MVTPRDIEAEHRTALLSLNTIQRMALARLLESRDTSLEHAFETEAAARNRVALSRALGTA